MLLVESKFVADVKVMLDGIAHRIQTSVSDAGDLEAVIVVVDGRLGDNAVLLLEVAFINGKYRLLINIVIFKDPVYQIRRKFFMRFV